MMIIYAAFDRDPCAQPIDEPPCCYPCPENGTCDPILCHKFHAWCAQEDWKRGKCYNCGCWGDQIADGEYECRNCGDIWNIYEPAPEIP